MKKDEVAALLKQALEVADLVSPTAERGATLDTDARMEKMFERGFFLRHAVDLLREDRTMLPRDLEKHLGRIADRTGFARESILEAMFLIAVWGMLEAEGDPRTPGMRARFEGKLGFIQIAATVRSMREKGEI